MGKRKTVEEERARAEALKQKSKDLEIKADIDEIKTLLNNYGQYAHRTLNFMKTLVHTKGKCCDDEELRRALQEAGGDSPPAKRAKESPAIAIEDRGDAGAAERGDCSDGGPRAQPTEKPIHHTAYSLQKLPVRDLKECLVSLEKIALSPFAIRAMAPRGARTASQKALAEVIEFCCGVSINASLDMAFMGSLPKLIGYLQGLNVKRGRRAQDLPLPPDWAKDGVYRKAVVEGALTIENRFTGERVPWPSAIPREGASIVDNFSEERAAAMCGAERVELRDLFLTRRAERRCPDANAESSGASCFAAATPAVRSGAPAASKLHSADAHAEGAKAKSDDQVNESGAEPVGEAGVETTSFTAPKKEAVIETDLAALMDASPGVSPGSPQRCQRKLPGPSGAEEEGGEGIPTPIPHDSLDGADSGDGEVDFVPAAPPPAS